MTKSLSAAEAEATRWCGDGDGESLCLPFEDGKGERKTDADADADVEGRWAGSDERGKAGTVGAANGLAEGEANAAMEGNVLCA